MICYLFPDSEDSPQYKPEKIIDCTIDTSNQFIGFRVSSDALDKLLQEPSREELPPILEISSVDVNDLQMNLLISCFHRTRARGSHQRIQLAANLVFLLKILEKIQSANAILVKKKRKQPLLTLAFFSNE